MKVVTVDVVVLGAGVNGSSAAYWLQKRGQTVLVLSKDVEGYATPASGGMLTPSAEAEDADSVLLDFAKENCAFYPEFVEMIERESLRSCGLNMNGTLMPALNNDDRLRLEHLAARQSKAGIETSWLTGAQSRELEPCLSPKVVGALWVPNDNCVNPRLFLDAIKAAAMAHGAYFMKVKRDPVLEVVNNRVVGLDCVLFGLETRVSARHFVVAAGSWCNRLLPKNSKLPLRPVKGQYLELAGPGIIKRVIRTPWAYLVPRADGTIYVGATSEEKGFDTSSVAGPLFDLYGHAWRVVPGIYESRIRLSSAGLRPALRDNLPAIGFTSVHGLSVMTGHYRHGIMLAPLSGFMMAKLIEGGDGDRFTDSFSPLRFDSPTRDGLAHAS